MAKQSSFFEIFYENQTKCDTIGLKRKHRKLKIKSHAEIQLEKMFLIGPLRKSKKTLLPASASQQLSPGLAAQMEGTHRAADLMTDIFSRLRRPWPLLWQESLSYTAKTRAKVAF